MSEIKSFEFSDRKGRKILIRNAKPEDAEQINLMKREIIAEGMYMLRETDEANYTTEKTINEISENTSNPGSMYIIAESDGKVAGELDFVNGSLKRTKHCGSFTVFISKEYRDSGIGLKLMDALLQWAEEEPIIEKVTLNVFSTNIRAQKLYEKCGFLIEGNCPKDMKLSNGDYIDSILMYKFVK